MKRGIFTREKEEKEALRHIEVFEIKGQWSGLSLGCWPPSLTGEFAVVSDTMLVLSKGWVGLFRSRAWRVGHHSSSSDLGASITRARGYDKSWDVRWW
ncbi:hypothetical protein TIFTF001_053081 [Ficus carica]|uniref:Uncharacterized protein n=1 Tax=Ficus carica TaxID=3494 RepID=A0AA88JGN3_FICCA|nr:hypothetical protein TIFTF001_053081 [Ficus carica]